MMAFATAVMLAVVMMLMLVLMLVSSGGGWLLARLGRFFGTTGLRWFRFRGRYGRRTRTLGALGGWVGDYL